MKSTVHNIIYADKVLEQ